MLAIQVNDRRWFVQQMPDGTADLYDHEGSFICSFESMSELEYFLMGVK